MPVQKACWSIRFSFMPKDGNFKRNGSAWVFAREIETAIAKLKSFYGEGFTFHGASRQTPCSQYVGVFLWDEDSDNPYIGEGQD